MELALPPEPKLQSLEDFVAETKPYLVRPRETRFGRVSFGELRLRKPQPPDFIVDDWMVAKEVSFFAGESEAGKTFLAIDVALRIALGWDVFGRKTKPGLVIYQIGESGGSLLDLRIPAWMSYFGRDLPDDVPFEILPSKVNLWTAEEGAKNGTKELLDAIKGIMAEYPDVPVSAVFIDTLSKAMIGGEENNGKDMGRVIANAELIASETGAHVPIIHHFPKGGTTLRGHGSLRADVNAVAMVSIDHQTKIRTITMDKLKDGEKRPMQFELMQIKLGQRDDGSPITSCIVLPVGVKAVVKADAGYRLNASEVVLFRALLDALAKYGRSPAPELGIRLSGRADKVVEYDEVKTLFGMANPYEGQKLNDETEARKAEERHRNKVKTRLRRAREDLMHPDANIIGMVGSLIFWTGRPVRDFKETQPPQKKEAAPNAAADEMVAQGLEGLL